MDNLTFMTVLCANVGIVALAVLAILLDNKVSRLQARLDKLESRIDKIAHLIGVNRSDQ